MFADFGEWKSGLTCYYEGEVLTRVDCVKVMNKMISFSILSWFPSIQTFQPTCII